MFVRGFAVIGPLVVMPYLVKTVGLDGWGKISFAIATASFGGAIVQYGFSISATADVARLRERPEQLEQSWRVHFVSTLLLAAGVLLLGALAIVSFESDAVMRLLLYGALLLSVATSLIPIWLFMGLERMRAVVISSFCTQIGYVLLVLALVRGPAQLRWVTLLGAIAASAGLLVALIQARREFRFQIPLRAPVARMADTLRSGFAVFLMMFVPMLYNAGSIFTLGVTATKSEVALLTIPAMLVETAIVVGRLVTNASLAMVATEESRFARFASYSMGIGLLGFVALAVISPLVAHWLTPEHAGKVTIVMILLAVSIPFGFAQLVFGQNYLAIHGHAAIASRIVVSSSIIGAILTVLVVPWAGAIGAAGVILVSRMLLGGQSYLAYRRSRSTRA
jgi:PST family polysaccharide transporter